MTPRFARLAVVSLLLGSTPAPVPAQSWDIKACNVDSIPYPFENGRGTRKFPEGSCPPPPNVPIACYANSKIKPIRAESQSHETYYTHIADYAIDDHLVTRWSAGHYTDRQWLQVDLGKSRVVKEVVLTWELAHAKDYVIQASSDGTSWNTVATVNEGDGFVDRVRVDAKGRFIRMQSVRRANEYGVSLFDFTLCSAARAPESARASTLGPTRHRPLVIAHRGASGHRPEHTLAAYALAIEMGADFIEPDLVSTKDSVLVARHENEIGGTTDVATLFPSRRTTKTIDGAAVTGWFTEDFTLAELRTVRAVERLPFRSRAHDRTLPIPTFAEVLDLVARESVRHGRQIGVYPETKHPTHFRTIGLPLEEPLLAELARRGWTTKQAPVFIQSFETGSLRALRSRTGVRLVQLIAASGAPHSSAGITASYASMITTDGLREIATYADAIGVEKSLVQPVDRAGALGAHSTLVADAHRIGLAVHVWTLRSDRAFLPAAYAGDAAAEWKRFASLGVDGMFGDFPDVGVAALGKRGD